jgi:hypothetical protein
MAEGQQQKKQDQRRSKGKDRSQQNRRFHPGQELRKMDPDAIPILKYGPNNNFM